MFAPSIVVFDFREFGVGALVFAGARRRVEQRLGIEIWS